MEAAALLRNEPNSVFMDHGSHGRLSPPNASRGVFQVWLELWSVKGAGRDFWFRRIPISFWLS